MTAIFDDRAPEGITPAAASTLVARDEVPPDLRERFSVRELPLVLIGQLVITGFTTWPMLRFFASRAPGDLNDPLHSAWIFAWSAHEIIRAPLQVFDAPMFHPDGLTLALAENMLGLSLPFAPLYWLTDNAILLMNTILFTSMAIGGVGMYVLARYAAATTGLAFAAGTAFAVMPYRMSQMGHPHVWGTHLLPVVLLLLLMCSERGIPRSAVRLRVSLLALVVAWQAWASLTGGMLVGLVVAAWSLWTLLRCQRDLLPGLARGLLGAGIGLLLAVPVAVPYLKLQADNPDYGHAREEVLNYSATPGAYLDPGPTGPVLDTIYAPLVRNFRTPKGSWEKHLFPGAWLTLAAIAAVPILLFTRQRGVAVPLLGLALVSVGFVLSLGPRYGAREDGLPMPFALLERLTGGLTRVPARMGILVPLGLALLVAAVLGRLPLVARRTVVAAFVVLLAAERYPPVIAFPKPPEITAAHRTVAGREGAVLALPVYEHNDAGTYIPGPLYDPQHLYLSTAHFRPLLNGYGSYLPGSYWETVHHAQNLPSRESLAFLARRGVHTVIVQTDLARGTRWETVVSALEQWPGVRRVATANGVVVLDIDEAARDADRNT